MTRSATRFALALSLLATPGVPLAAQTFDAGATRYLFMGCDAHLCESLTLYAEPAAQIGGGPYPIALGFAVTHTYLDAGDELGVGWSLSTDTFAESWGVGNATWDGDQNGIGAHCQLARYVVSGTCSDPVTIRSGWTSALRSPTDGWGVTVGYLVGPVGAELPGGSLFAAPNARALRLSLISVTAVPEPATWALVSGGLLVLAGVARRRAT